MTDDRHARRTTHLARLIVGLTWAFMALMTSAIYDEIGYGAAESVVFGVVTVPVMLIGFYALGTIGLWVMEATGVRRMLG